MLQDFQPISPTLTRPRVALLIDGDNISHDQAGRILLHADRLGDTLIRRVYGNAALRPGWLTAPGLTFRHAGAGKNAADLLLTVEAMELMLTDRADVLVVASSDRDFSHLATHLREQGRKVIGIGEAKAPEGFRKACSAFVELPPQVANAKGPGVAVAPMAKLEDQVAALVRNDGGTAGYPIQLLGVRMHKMHGTLISQQPQKTWRAWLQARHDLFDCDAKGPEARVRLKA